MQRLTLMLFTGMICLSTATYANDLLAVYRLAQTNDPTLQSAKEAHLASIEALPQARAQFFPSIQAVTSHTAYDNGGNNATSIPPGGVTRAHYNQSSYGLNLTQPVFYYQEWVQLSKASNQVKQANANYAAAEQDLIVRAVQRYFGVLKAFDALKFAKAQRKAFAKFLEQTEQRYKVGLIAITDVQIAKAQHDNAYAQEISAENDLANQKEILREITGKEIDRYSFLRDELTLKAPEPQNLETWVLQALDQNLSLQAIEFQVKSAHDDIKIAQTGHLPTLDVSSSINRVTSTPYTTSTNNANLGLQVTLPIFSGGAVSSKTRQAVHTYAKSQKDRETLHRQTESNTRQSYRNVLTQISQADALKQAIVSNKSALEATEASFNVGTRTIVDVLNAQSSLIQAEQNYAFARYDYILQSISLKQAAGTLNPEDIQHINAWLTKEQ